MRNLVLLLVLINLGVFAWFSWIVPAPPAPAVYDGPGITLLRELPADAAIVTAADPAARDLSSVPAALPAGASAAAGADDRGAGAGSGSDGGGSDGGGSDGGGTDGGGAEDLLLAASSPPLADRVPSAARCVAIGPFTDAAQADAALATLVDAGFAPSLSVSQDEVWDGYWVYVGRLESREAARDALAVLAGNGLGDAYVIPNSDSGIIISLGVYSDISRAGALADRVGNLGFDTTITERTRTAETRWLELDLSGEESQALELLQEPGRIRRLEQRGCTNDGDG